VSAPPSPITFGLFTATAANKRDALGRFRWRIFGPKFSTHEWLTEEDAAARVAKLAADHGGPAPEGVIPEPVTPKRGHDVVYPAPTDPAAEAFAEICGVLAFVRLDEEPLTNVDGAIARARAAATLIGTERAERDVAKAKAREEGRLLADRELRDALAGERQAHDMTRGELDMLRNSAAEAERQLDALTAVCELLGATGDDVVAKLRATLNPATPEDCDARASALTARAVELRAIAEDEARLVAQLDTLRERRAALLAA
jgi:predicted transcriptional regulator